MPNLHPQLRSQLERVVISARRVAEKGAGDALNALGVDQEPAPDHLSEAQRKQRVKLRAEMRRLGGFTDLRGEVAYETWHKMLFARFLLRNGLLMYDGFAVSGDDLSDAGTLEHFGVSSEAELEIQLATAMLPGLFESSDPSWNVTLPTETRVELGTLLDSLAPEIFEADDSLGWVYQYWQSARKAAVNAHAGGNRIAAADVSAVTQLFTEPYMVDWLLDQTLGQMDGAAQTKVRLLDPCCGSGHFLVTAFNRLHAARMEHLEEDAATAAEGVLRENLFGLELDARCVQLAGFALLLAAWKRGGFRNLPLPHVACSGLAASGTQQDWTRLANGDGALSNALFLLYHLFQSAPALGSLIDPRNLADGPYRALLDWEEVEPTLRCALEKFGGEADPVEGIFGLGARGLIRAVSILIGHYDLVITNVPYLGTGKQNIELVDFCKKNYPLSKDDLATVFIERSLKWLRQEGQIALVTPQNWLYSGDYANLRKHILETVTWQSLARIGEGGFTSSSAAGAFVALFTLSKKVPNEGSAFQVVDVSSLKTPVHKALALQETPYTEVSQAAQLLNPKWRITSEALVETEARVNSYATATEGLSTGDADRYIRFFWEQNEDHAIWTPLQTGSDDGSLFDNCSRVMLWENGHGELFKDKGARLRGRTAWGKQGVLISRMRTVRVCLHNGNFFDKTCVAVVPKNPEHLLPLLSFCQSPELETEARRLNQGLNIATSVFADVPFDLKKWTKVAQEQYPYGLPKPFSDNPTQLLFDGTPQSALARGADETLQVATARLLGYRWPDQKDCALDDLTDGDGIVCLPACNGERDAASRLREILFAALPDEQGPVEWLLDGIGWSGKTLDDWLRNGFWRAHCRMFGNRPFLWHIWDGHPQGFAAIVNYHGLDRLKLDKLIYTYLGDYLRGAEAAAQNDEPGATQRVTAARGLKQKLEQIALGESPFDIYVRWKPLDKQPIGWEPDLNDGVRLNIRPFVQAGILRTPFTVNWSKDKGKNPDGSERLNDLHLTLEEKRRARGATS